MADVKNYYVGFDTSNYTTSMAACDEDGNVLVNEKMPLSVKDGNRGLRQSDAVFLLNPHDSYYAQDEAGPAPSCLLSKCPSPNTHHVNISLKCQARKGCRRNHEPCAGRPPMCPHLCSPLRI